MAFAKDYKEEITLAYYCLSSLITIAAFIIGTIYLWHKDRVDEQRREIWSRFAERVYSEYKSLKVKDIPRRILKVKDTFQNIRMNSKITGLDVLRYMLSDENYERSKTVQLKCLREDLQSIFQLFNVCSSLILLVKIPKNIKEELKDVVSELGNIAEPFFKGKQRKIILECLEHFGNNRPKPETERRVRDLDDKLEVGVPYVKSCLRFASPNSALQNMVRPFAGFGQGGTPIMELVNSDYSKCSNFSLKISRKSIPLIDLHDKLREPWYTVGFARKLRECPIPLLFEHLNDNDEDELVMVKVLHEVRCYIHVYLNENQPVEHREQIEKNIKRLCDVEENVSRFNPTEAQVKEICKRFIGDLQRLSASPYHCNSQDFCKELRNLWMKLRELQIIRTNVDPSLPSTSQTANHIRETVV